MPENIPAPPPRDRRRGPVPPDDKRLAANSDLSPAERRERARAAALARWARTRDRAAATAPARTAAIARYAAAAELGIADELQRQLMTAAAEHQHMAKMRLARSRKARIARKARQAAQDAAGDGEAAV